jgi:hypothetical protein
VRECLWRQLYRGNRRRGSALTPTGGPAAPARDAGLQVLLIGGVSAGIGWVIGHLVTNIVG